MTASDSSERPPSLLAITVRRSFSVGRVYLVLSTALSLFYTIVLSIVPGNAFISAFPLLLPILGTMGAMGSMLVFTNDRTKGVFEYLIAYGVPPRRIFLNVVETSLVMLSVVEAVTLVAGLGLRAAVGQPIPLPFILDIAVYSLPMSYGTAALTSAAGMFWTSLSSPRQGMNSPLGLLPMVGVAPGVLVLIIAEAVGPARAPYVAVSAVIIVVLTAVALLTLGGRLMPRERLLSPA